MSVATQPNLIRVLIVDDSPLAVEVVRRMLSTAQDLLVIGVASDGQEALRLIPRLRPDVICTDLHMPNMDGLALTRAVLAQFPTPILVLSASVQAGQTRNIFELLEAGAIDVFPKPLGGGSAEFLAIAPELVRKVRILSGVKVMRRGAARAPAAAVAPPSPGRHEPRDMLEKLAPREASRPSLVAIGSSTGGPQALEELLGALPADFPAPILCVQHIAAGFMSALVDWLGGHCRLRVRLARDGELPQPGSVYFAPDDADVEIDAQGRFRAVAPKASGPRPSIDVTFRSVARRYGARTLGVLLTGMGSDGAQGMRAIADAGGVTLSQDEESCVVYGMPREAVALGAVSRVLPLEKIAAALIAVAQGEGVAP